MLVCRRLDGLPRIRRLGLLSSIPIGERAVRAYPDTIRRTQSASVVRF